MSTDAVDISQLTQAQQAALQEYTSITQQDPLPAIPLLQRAEWNVQIAVTRFFEGEPTTDILAEAHAAIPPPGERQRTNLQLEAILAETRRSPIPIVADVVQPIDADSRGFPQYRPGLLLSILFTPFKILYGVISTLFSPFSFILPGFVTRALSNLLTTAPKTTRRPLPPSETAHRFIREFNEEYPSPPVLPWAESGFNLCLSTAKSKQKFLLAVLLSPSHDETPSYVQETLQTTTFAAFLQSHSSDLILWGGNIQEVEAYQVSTNLNCTKFPFAALICQTPANPTSTTARGGNMTVVSRLTGSMSASELVAKLSTAMTSHQAALRAAKAAQAEQQASRSLRDEQDSAYERSLAQDRERARKRREEAEAKANAEKEAIRRAEEAESTRRKQDQWRRWKARTVAEEVSADYKDALRVSIRMPDGQRVIRRFKTDQTVQNLYDFVECFDILQSSPSLSSNSHSSDDVSEPVDYQHSYKFRLVSPMPRTVYDLEQGGTIGGKIGRGANLIVEPLENDEDEEGEKNDNLV